MEEIVAFMPIRLNSERIREKSIVDVLGRPMFCWSLQTLDSLGIPVYVYTSEEQRLIEVLDFETKNITFLSRPKKLDKHDTMGIDIYKEFAKQIPAKNYLLVHCTSPFVKMESYRKCVQAVLEGYDSSMTVREEKTFCWYKGKPINFKIPRPKTQEIEPIFIETSAAYCYSSEILKHNSRTGDSLFLVTTSGLETMDIDDPEDLEIINKKGLL